MRRLQDYGGRIGWNRDEHWSFCVATDKANKRKNRNMDSNRASRTQQRIADILASL